MSQNIRAIAQEVQKEICYCNCGDAGLPFLCTSKVDIIERALDEVIANENEACAKICDQGDGGMSSMSEHQWGNCFRDRIRARLKK